MTLKYVFIKENQEFLAYRNEISLRPITLNIITLYRIAKNQFEDYETPDAIYDGIEYLSNTTSEYQEDMYRFLIICDIWYSLGLKQTFA